MVNVDYEKISLIPSMLIHLLPKCVYIEFKIMESVFHLLSQTSKLEVYWQAPLPVRYHEHQQVLTNRVMTYHF